MKIISTLLVALMLVSCASSDKEVLEPMELEKITATAKIQKLWSRDVGAGQDARYTQLVPAVIGDAIVTTDIEGTVTKLNRENGKVLWRVKLNERVSAGVGAGNGMLFLGTYDAYVIALNADTGEEMWRRLVASEILAPPQTNGRIVAVQTLDDQLYALDFKSGEQLWSYEVTTPALTVRGTASPVLTRNAVYAGFANGKVYALQAEDGLLQWDQRVAIPQGRGDFERMVDIDATPLLVREILFCASFQGQITALSRANGRTLWSKPVSTSYNLSSGQSKVYLSDDQSSIKAYNIGNGEIVWENNQLLRRKVYAPQVVGNYVALVDEEDGILHLLNQSDGSFAARRNVGDVRSPMASVGDILYVLTDDGDLLALRVMPIDS